MSPPHSCPRCEATALSGLTPEERVAKFVDGRMTRGERAGFLLTVLNDRNFRDHVATLATALRHIEEEDGE
jgi:hypothetical protein